MIYASIEKPKTFNKIKTKPRMAIITSGNGSNFLALHKAIKQKKLDANIAVLISNNKESASIKKAINLKIPYDIVDKKDSTIDEEILKFIKKRNIDLIVLAGFTKIIGKSIIDYMPDDRIINIHPAPLPQFGGKGMYGIYVHKKVLSSNIKRSGPTIHIVNEKYDEGRILTHQDFKIDSLCYENNGEFILQSQVLQIEHELYWKTIQCYFCNSEIGLIAQLLKIPINLARSIYNIRECGF